MSEIKARWLLDNDPTHIRGRSLKRFNYGEVNADNKDRRYPPPPPAAPSSSRGNYLLLIIGIGLMLAASVDEEQVCPAQIADFVLYTPKNMN